MVKFLQIPACKISVGGGRLCRGKTWIGWMSVTMREAAGESSWSKGRAGEDAGTAHGSSRKAAEESEQCLSSCCCQSPSVLLLARCFWNAGPQLHLCQLLGQKGCRVPWAHIHSQAGRGRSWRSLSQAGGQEGAELQVISPVLLPWQITLPVCSAAQSYLPRLLSPGGDYRWWTWQLKLLGLSAKFLLWCITWLMFNDLPSVPSRS